MADRTPGQHGTLAERLWSRVEKTDTCWLWTGYVMRDSGHGQIQGGRRGGGARRVHIAAWELLVGPVPQGMVLHHRCEVKSCVNPSHLELMTRAEHASHHHRQVTCHLGHPLDYIWHGKRACKTCARERARRYYREGRRG